MLPTWVKNYVGIPFEQVNCWQLVCKIYREQLAIDLPYLDDDYADALDKAAIANLYERELATVWQKVHTPTPFDCIVFRIQGQLWHVGLIVAKNEMLHTHDKIDSTVERYNTRLWRHRIDGFYKYKKE